MSNGRSLDVVTYEFIAKNASGVVTRNLGDARKLVIKAVLDGKRPDEEIYVAVCGTGGHYRVQRH
jgi:hypothetical protein